MAVKKKRVRMLCPKCKVELQQYDDNYESIGRCPKCKELYCA